MILVTGAAGKTGRAVVKALDARGARVRALVRRPEHAAALMGSAPPKSTSAASRIRDALARAAAGVEAIYHICPNVSRDEVAYARAVVAAAQAHGVERFVYHSVLHPQIAAMPHHWQKMRVEEMLFAVRPQSHDPAADRVHAEHSRCMARASSSDGVFRIPYPVETRLSLVDLDDVAAAAAIVLTDDSHVGATYELVGTPPLSQTEVAAAIGAALGREVRAEAETLEAWEARARAGGMGDYERATLAAMFRYYADTG